MERPIMSVSEPFNSPFSEAVFRQKYGRRGPDDVSWNWVAASCAHDVTDGHVSDGVRDAIFDEIRTMRFIPGGRYLYYAGRDASFWNNCYLLRAEEDTREDWANLSWKAESCLMTGGGIGIDYSVYRPKGSILGRTGGTASGPIPKMLMINEIGRHVMQGGSRRSAIYASLDLSMSKP
jgi:ribonucleoside-diphosphate reductase alpha chain